jgi:triacylglycerol lipase
VLVHGLLDTPAVFDALKRELGGGRQPLLIPALPLRLGRTSVLEAAGLLGSHIEAAFGLEESLDLLGFSIGGVIARCWIQLLGGHARTRRFISVGSPQQGTLTALPWPGRFFRGIADLRWGSTLLERLNGDLERLQRIDCHSFYSALDLAVLPGWRAVLPMGPRTMLPVLTHPQLLRDRAALVPLARELLRA